MAARSRRSYPQLVVRLAARTAAFSASRALTREANLRRPSRPPPSCGEGVVLATRYVTPRQACPRPITVSGATCVQRLDDSRDSAIHTKYRISLRSSSMREPRYPLPRVVPLLGKSSPPSAPMARNGRAPCSTRSSLAHPAPNFSLW